LPRNISNNRINNEYFLKNSRSIDESSSSDEENSMSIEANIAQGKHDLMKINEVKHNYIFK